MLGKGRDEIAREKAEAQAKLRKAWANPGSRLEARFVRDDLYAERLDRVCDRGGAASPLPVDRSRFEREDPDAGGVEPLWRLTNGSTPTLRFPQANT